MIGCHIQFWEVAVVISLFWMRMHRVPGLQECVLLLLCAEHKHIGLQIRVNSTKNKSTCSYTKFVDAIYIYVKVKKIKWSRYRPSVVQRAGRGIALLFHDRGTRKGWVVSSTPRSHFTPEKDPQFRPEPARKLSANLYDVNHCGVYSEKILMMNRGTVRNM